MLRKVVSIKNIGKFTQYTCVGDVRFEKLNLLFADNGCGKTTLTHIFRSLKTGEAKYIQERRTAGSSADCTVCLVTETSRVEFKESAWDSNLPELEIFDSTFVNENVYSGYTVDIDHKRQLYRFMIGEEGIALSQRIDELDRQIREMNSELQILRRGIENYIEGEMTLDDFVDLEPRENIEELIAEKQAEVATISKTRDILDHSLLSPLPVPDFPIDRVKSLLGQEVEGISHQAAERIQEHITQHMDEEGENWISVGLGYVNGDICPFCGQNLSPTNNLVTLYSRFFSQTYAELKQQTLELVAEIEGCMSTENLLQIANHVKDNQRCAEFWHGFIAIDYPSLSLDNFQTTWQALASGLREHLQQKYSSPLEPIQFDTSLQALEKTFHDLLEEAAIYNDRVRDINQRIELLRSTMTKADSASARKCLTILNNTKYRFQADVNENCEGYRALKNQKADAERQKRETRTELDRFTEAMMNRYQERLNYYLGIFGTEYRIEADPRPSYAGGRPSSNYRIVINNVSIPVGNISNGSEPSFKTLLSQGDKNTLAFALFLSRVDLDENLKDKIIVFDDPISSLDHNRRRCTQQQINRITHAAKQVIVLSHDPYFLKTLWDAGTHASTRTFAIVRATNTSKITVWDIDQATQGEYFRDYFALQGYLRDGPEGKDLRSIARCIRPLLEGNLRLRFPNEFPPGDWLGDFLGRIRDAQPGEPLYIFQDQYSELDSINGYSKRYHHIENPDADNEPISDSELRAFVQRTLAVIGGILTASFGENLND